jgi:hypothetical protein
MLRTGNDLSISISVCDFCAAFDDTVWCIRRHVFLQSLILIEMGQQKRMEAKWKHFGIQHEAGIEICTKTQHQLNFRLMFKILLHCIVKVLHI